MAWRIVTEQDLNATLSRTEIESFRRSSVDGDPVDAQIASAVAYVRGIVRSSPARVRLGPEGTLPESLVLPAMERLRFSILTRMDIPVNESRRLSYEKAEELLEKVRSGAFIPEGDGEETGGGDVAASPAVGPVNPAHLLD